MDGQMNFYNEFLHCGKCAFNLADGIPSSAYMIP